MSYDAQQPTSISVEAVVIRADGRREDLGVVAYHHRNPLRVWAWRLGRWMRGLKAGMIRVKKETQR